jgi:hypothetical protein
MVNTITVSNEDIILQLKVSCQLPATIADIVQRKTIESKAKELGITIEPEELQEAADNFRSLNQLWRAGDTWSWLQNHYLSLDEFEAAIYSNALSTKLAHHLFADKIEPFFVEHQLDYAGVALYEVVLDDEDLAMELFYAIQEGEMNFYEVAHQYIQETDLRRSKGYQGVLRRHDLRPEISAAVFAATPPQLLKPIMTSKGAHLILVEEVIQPDLDQSLRHKILLELFSDWLKKQVAQVDIVTQLHSELTSPTPEHAPAVTASS